MAKDPAVLFYTSDFLIGTTLFSMEQKGQYITLLCEQHQLGHLPENHMISICGSLDSVVIGKFVKDEKGLYYNQRMEEEHQKRVNYCNSRSNNKSGRPKKKSCVKSYDIRKNIHMENENENENRSKDKNEISEEFEKARKFYPGRKGGYKIEFQNFTKKHKDWKEALALLIPAIQIQIEYREKAIKADAFVPEWKHFQTWINKRCWEDEMPKIVEKKTKSLLDDLKENHA